MTAPALLSHLAHQLGQWPPRAPVVVTTSAARHTPGWDGVIRQFAGLRTPDGTVVSVPERAVDALAPYATDLDTLRPRVAAHFGRPVVEIAFRTTTAPAPLDDLGTWIPHDDPRVPEWLRPFGAAVLVALDDDDRYLAGVGLKRHDEHAWEISVGTDERARGLGLARRLVATAARRVLADGRAVTYLHALDNVASSRVADAAGFPDHGWRALELGDDAAG
ncbi:MAG TPA: GNAT family N-acetyltransferase [Acidimicrobiia bacterium]|nr:GNAT family N-acetyltransferase [Acidimicrobiia bacterium]